MRFVIFGGTTEGRALSRELAALGADVTACVATEYGREEQGEFPGITVLTGRLEIDGMVKVLRGAALCVDATHPYAIRATENIRAAAERESVPYKRLLRRASVLPVDSVVVENADEAVGFLAGMAGNILLTTGAKELAAFASLGGERLYPRVLPLAESLAACEAAGIPQSNIIAMQGPFSEELNLALIRQFSICCLVTKDGGEAGGFAEKAAAAAAGGAVLIVIRRPEEHGEDYETIFNHCRELLLL